MKYGCYVVVYPFPSSINDDQYYIMNDENQQKPTDNCFTKCCNLTKLTLMIRKIQEFS
jgi:hypothetical protein